MKSTVEELDKLVPDWHAGVLTWDMFGECLQNELDVFKNYWKLRDKDRNMLQSIWNRHPDRWHLNYGFGEIPPWSDPCFLSFMQIGQCVRRRSSKKSKL